MMHCFRVSLDGVALPVEFFRFPEELDVDRCFFTASFFCCACACTCLHLLAPGTTSNLSIIDLDATRKRLIACELRGRLECMG